MLNIQFEDRAVAFIDVLGFKTIVNKASENESDLQKLNSLITLLDSAVPDLNEAMVNVPPIYRPQYIYVSDSIILSAPLSIENKKYFCGLGVIVMRCIQLMHHLLNDGYLIRGGIEIGKVWHTETNIIGPAYQEAYKIETCAKNPQIILGIKASELWRKKNNKLNQMCIDRNGVLIVNGLCDLYTPEPDSVEERYKTYRQIIESSLKQGLEPRALEKWEWYKEHFEDVLKDYPV